MRLPILLLAAAAAIPAFSATAAVPLDRIVAVVDDGVVVQSELERAMQIARSQLRARSLAVPPDEVLREQVLERLVLMRLQTQRAQQAGIRVDDRELNEVLTNISAQNGMGLAEFAESVRRDGGDYLAVREQVRDEILVQRLRQREVEEHIGVTDQDIDLFLANQSGADDTEVRLSHILVAVPDGATSEVRAQRRQKADDLLKRIKAGEEFAQVAIAESDGQQALQGGDLEWRRVGDLPALFADQARTLDEGALSGVLETSSGFHLVRVSGRRGGEPRRVVTETRARHILLTPNQIRDEEATRVQARELYDRLVAGGDFSQIAHDFSDDPGSKNSGGDLDWQPPGIFAPEFQMRIDQLAPGQMSPPFRSQFGWHIARVEERRSRDTTVESKRARARTAIMRRKVEEEYDAWLRRIREEAYVEYRLNPGAAATTPSG